MHQASSYQFIKFLAVMKWTTIIKFFVLFVPPSTFLKDFCVAGSRKSAVISYSERAIERKRERERERPGPSGLGYRPSVGLRVDTAASGQTA
jgi:hypothetical protein